MADVETYLPSCDYFPSGKVLVLRMLSDVHESFLYRLTGRITERLRRLSLEPGPAADFAKGIRYNGSATIRPLVPGYGDHDPDGSFRHVKSPASTVIVEVAHSQNGKALERLAEEYLLGSRVGIRVMVGVDIEYSKNQRATFSIWRPKQQDDKVWVAEPTVADQASLLLDFQPRGQN